MDAPLNDQAGRFDYAADAIVGQRSEQQDSFFTSPVKLNNDQDAVLLVVADGMGGAVGGRRASQCAIETFRASFAGTQEAPTAARLKTALLAANEAISQEIRVNKRLKGMGCTLVAAVFDGARVTWISVGDSLLIAVDAANIKRLNADHSLAPVLDRAAARGELDRADAEASPDRSVLRSALTGGPIALVDEGSSPLKPGTRLLVASDGLLTLSRETMQRIAVEARSAADFVKQVLADVSANMPADQDNLTIATLIAGQEGATTAAGVQPVAPWAKIILGVAIAILATAVIALIVLSVKPQPQPHVVTGKKDAGAATSSVAASAASPREVTEPVDKKDIITIPKGLDGTQPKKEAPKAPPPPPEKHDARKPAETHPKPAAAAPKSAATPPPSKPNPHASPSAATAPAISPPRSGSGSPSVEVTPEGKHHDKSDDPIRL